MADSFNTSAESSQFKNPNADFRSGRAASTPGATPSTPTNMLQTPIANDRTAKQAKIEAMKRRMGA